MTRSPCALVACPADVVAAAFLKPTALYSACASQGCDACRVPLVMGNHAWVVQEAVSDEAKSAS